MIKIIDLDFLNKKSAIACFLIQEENNLILVETGPSVSYGVIKSTLEKKRLDIKKISHVFVTHIHLDHSGGAWKFAENGAKIYVHPKGAPHLIDPERLISSAGKIYGDKMDMLWGNVKKINNKNVISVDHEEVISINGVEFQSFHTPGHASHHISWKLGDCMFTGDIAGAKIKNGPVLPACPPPDINLEDWENSLQIIEKENPKKMFLTHFGCHLNSRDHLDELRDELRDWCNWIRNNMYNFSDDNTLIKKFDQYVYKKMVSKKISNKLIAQYYAANPPYMSVSGLKRYIEKQNV